MHSEYRKICILRVAYQRFNIFSLHVQIITCTVVKTVKRFLVGTGRRLPIVIVNQGAAAIRYQHVPFCLPAACTKKWQ